MAMLSSLVLARLIQSIPSYCSFLLYFLLEITFVSCFKVVSRLEWRFTLIILFPCHDYSHRRSRQSHQATSFIRSLLVSQIPRESQGDLAANLDLFLFKKDTGNVLLQWFLYWRKIVGSTVCTWSARIFVTTPLGAPDTLEFTRSALLQDIISLFNDAACVESNKGLLVKVVDVNGDVVPISSSMPVNTDSTRYTLVVEQGRNDLFYL